MSKTIYELELNETLAVRQVREPNMSDFVQVRRVPGGWIYTSTKTLREGSEFVMSESSVFVPYNKEYAPKSNNIGVTYS